jgi:hypothetical protein
VPFVSGVAEAYYDLLQFDMQLGIANRVTRNASKCVCLHWGHCRVAVRGALESSLHVQRGAQGKADDPLFWLDSTSEQAARDEAERRLAQDRADCSAPAEMSAALRSSRLSFDPPETTVFVHRSLAAQLLTSATSRRHLLGTVYALGRLGQRCEPVTTLKM